MHTALVVGLALLTLVAVSLQRTYARVPLRELKRRARAGDELARAIMKAVGFGHSLRAVLWFLIGITAAGFFVAVSLSAPTWFALIASGVLIWVGFVLIPAARVSFISERIAVWSAPVLAKVAGFLHPVIDWLVLFAHKHHPVHIHTGLYDRLDLIDLLERQQVQPDNQIEKAELDLALHALQYGDDTVGQHMVPRRVVKSVSIDEPLGPVIMDELHASGFSRFPVYEGKAGNIIGTLYLRDLVKVKSAGTLHKLIKHDVSYIHEEQSLHDALQAILKTHRQLFVVVNSFEEYVGIITIEDILETILGKPIIDEFDQYDDLRAVAERAAKKEHAQHVQEEAEPENSAEFEVVEDEEIDTPAQDTQETTTEDETEVVE